MKVIQYRRKREGKTNYNTRLKLLLSRKPRLIIRKSLNNIYAQIAEYDQKGDKIIVAANSKELKKLGWEEHPSNIPSAYLVGLLIGKKAKEKGINEAVLDIGFNMSSKGSKIYSCLKGAIEAGLNVPHSDKVLPDDERVLGKHIQGKEIEQKVNEIKQKIKGQNHEKYHLS